MKYIITTTEKATIKNYLVLCFNSLSQFMCSNMCLSRVQFGLYSTNPQQVILNRNTINDFLINLNAHFKRITFIPNN